jgi:formylglycine-generating enzyme required for sulfatase activity
MAGNVRSGLSSGYDSTGNGKVLRGGSWDDRPKFVRSANRGGEPPAARYDANGFRCAKDAR